VANPLYLPKMLELVRELDLSALQRLAEGRFYLLVVGEEPLAQGLAERLSEMPGRTGVHPWLSVLEGAVEEGHPLPMAPPDGVLFVSADTAAPPRAVSEAAARSGVPLLRVCVASPAEVGADLPRPGETGRALLPDLTPEAVRHALAPALLRALPERLHLALARQLPALRPALFRGLIEGTARANALYAASSSVVGLVPVLNLPVALADTVVLSKNQLTMTYKLALAAGKTGGAQEVLTEALGVLGGGLLFRQVARGLVGLVPVWGAVPKVAVAYAGTWVIGQAAERWVTQGRVPSAAELRPLYQEALVRGQRLARSLVSRKRRAQKALPAPEAQSTEEALEASQPD
jgi:uncharacterized protein (DUF697 family)